MSEKKERQTVEQMLEKIKREQPDLSGFGAQFLAKALFNMDNIVESFNENRPLTQDEFTQLFALVMVATGLAAIIPPTLANFAVESMSNMAEAEAKRRGLVFPSTDTLQ